MSKIVKRILYKDLKAVAVQDNGEILVPVNRFDKSILFGYEGIKKPDWFGDQMMVRETVAKKLAAANKKLQENNPNFSLKVIYGYRPFDIQKHYFEEVSRNLKLSSRNYKDEDAFLEEAHAYIAVPAVAGHPAGGAVDVMIFDRQAQENLDMGSKTDDFRDTKISWLANGLSKVQISNRRLLFSVMTWSGFAPFWGEWWHYSYGDREWAAYYGKSKAIYDCISTNNTAKQ